MYNVHSYTYTRNHINVSRLSILIVLVMYINQVKNRKLNKNGAVLLHHNHHNHKHFSIKLNFLLFFLYSLNNIENWILFIKWSEFGNKFADKIFVLFPAYVWCFLGEIIFALTAIGGFFIWFTQLSLMMRNI